MLMLNRSQYYSGSWHIDNRIDSSSWYVAIKVQGDAYSNNLIRKLLPAGNAWKTSLGATLAVLMSYMNYTAHNEGMHDVL